MALMLLLAELRWSVPDSWPSVLVVWFWSVGDLTLASGEAQSERKTC